MNQEWIAVTDRKQCGGEFLKTVQTLAGQGLKTIILREKDLSEEEYGELAARCMEICRKTGASLTLHKYFHAAWEQTGSICRTLYFGRMQVRLISIFM